MIIIIRSSITYIVPLLLLLWLLLLLLLLLLLFYYYNYCCYYYSYVIFMTSYYIIWCIYYNYFAGNFMNFKIEHIWTSSCLHRPSSTCVGLSLFQSLRSHNLDSLRAAVSYDNSLSSCRTNLIRARIFGVKWTLRKTCRVSADYYTIKYPEMVYIASRQLCYPTQQVPTIVFWAKTVVWLWVVDAFVVGSH